MSSQIQLFFDGVATEKAPAIHRLVQADLDTLLRWAVMNGANPMQNTIPPTFDWSMDEQIRTAVDGSDASGPGLFFGFDIEDRWIYSANVNASTPLKVQTRAYTKNGRTLSFRGIELIKPRLINQDSFPAVYNPSTYIVPAGVPWHGRFKLMRAQGYIKQDRWTSFGVHAFEMEPIGRLHRNYVRFQLDEGSVGMRSYPGVTEAPCIYPDEKLSGNLAICDNFTLPLTQWYWMEIEVLRIRPGTLRYTMKVKDPYTGSLDEPSTWTVLADLYGDRADTPDAVGMFFFHKYANSGTLSSAVWAKWEVHVSEIVN